MAAFVLILIILLVLGSNEAIDYYFSHCQEVDALDCIMGNLDEEEPEEGAVKATGTYEYKGYAVTMSY